MPDVGKIDRQGRILIPAHTRKLMGLEPNTEISIKISGNALIIEKINPDLQATVQQWKRDLINMPIPINETRNNAEDTDQKWIDDEYAKKKLGLG